MQKMNWDDLRFFLAVAREGSLSAAARALRVSQPTVARRIEQLEQQAGQVLFGRDCQGVCLNEAGQAVLRFVEGMEREAEGIDNFLHNAARLPRPTVRIATTFNLANFWLTDKLAGLSHRDSSVRYAVQVGIEKADVQRYCADIAVRMGDPEDETLFGRRVGKVHCGLYASDAYLADRGLPQSPAALAGHRIIGAEGAVENLPQCTALRQLSGSDGCDFCADNTNIQLAAARAGLGIATLPCFVAESEKTLQRILPEDFDIPVDLWVLVNHDLKESGPVRRTYDFILNEALRDSALFKGAAAGPEGTSDGKVVSLSAAQ